MEARIKKLQVDQDKAKKRITDAKRQQVFLEGMKAEKERTRRDRMKWEEERAGDEEEQRRRIMEERQQQREHIYRKI